MTAIAAKRSSFTDPCSAAISPPFSIVGESKEQCDALFAKLSDGGEVKMPLQETFWGAYFGMCRDRFDINWMINYELGSGAG